LWSRGNPSFADFPGDENLARTEIGEALVVGMTGCSAVDVNNECEVGGHDFRIFRKVYVISIISVFL
jgi:hypothetical protein